MTCILLVLKQKPHSGTHKYSHDMVNNLSVYSLSIGFFFLSWSVLVIYPQHSVKADEIMHPFPNISSSMQHIL